MSGMATAAERPALTLVPVAWQGEDSDTWWAEGHWPGQLMLLAVLCECMLVSSLELDDIKMLLVGSTRPHQEIGDEWAQMAKVEERCGSVDRIWLKPDPANEENMLPAEEGDPEAFPWTRFRA